ncbi:MAG: uroporphyrinogen decarboxylase family protein [Nitrososphaerota archaeon]
MNKRERVLKTLEIKEPDKVPIMEVDMDVPIMEALSGEKFPQATSLQTQVISDRNLERKRCELKIKCYKKVDFDVVTADLSAPEDWKPIMKTNDTLIDLFGRILMLDKKSMAWVPYGTIFNNPEDFENFDLPNPNAPGWTFGIEYTKKIIKDDMALAAFIRDPFAHAWEMFTPMKFTIWMYQKPNFIKNVIEKLTEFNIEIIKQISEAGADFIISGGDYCEEKGPMVSIKFFREVIFPNLKKQVDIAHKKGLKFIKHTDGNIMPLLDDLSKIVDGLHSLDPSAGVDIGKVKEKYGHKLILIGNISVDNLARKSKEEIIEETKNCIRKASPGGGHILSSSNSWSAGAKLENCLAMVETGRRYGIYPIKIE